MSTELNILILAAGLGTRMKSKTAKVLHRAGGRALIEHVVRTALQVAPADRITVVVGYQAEEVRALVEGHGVRFVLQSEQRGTGHAVMAAQEVLRGAGGLLLVLYGDCPLLSARTLRELAARQAASAASSTVITVRLDDPTGYGRVLTDQDGQIKAIVEQKAATPEQLKIREINSGIYCFRNDLLWKHLDEIGAGNPAGEHYLTDIVAIFRRAGYRVDAFRLEDATEVLGVNTRMELAAVDRILRERKVRELMLDGVTIEKPETVIVDPDVRVGPDTIIGPFAQLLGRTEVGEESRIGAASLISDSRLADRVEIQPFTTIHDSEVGSGARIGPYARLRFGTQVKEGAAIGNFVEAKKTRLGEGSKALHLAYLGDSIIGARANIGAGTITCNYDGFGKYETRIGDGAFIGSNATLVAPVEIGAGSYIGAGSVITDSVPADALALGRERQVNKEGWARRRREKAGRATE